MGSGSGTDAETRGMRYLFKLRQTGKFKTFIKQAFSPDVSILIHPGRIDLDTSARTGQRPGRDGKG
jgi:hypothetical protein